MAFDFWQAQRNLKWKTTFYLILFIAMTLFIAFLAEFAFQAAVASDEFEEPFPIVAVIFALVTFITAAFNYGMYHLQGGAYVAEGVGARQITKNTNHPKELQYYNIVEEIAIASALPMPAVYLLQAEAINAFAAGLKQDNAAITVTTGALNQLSRDELQGVIAHEFGHIYNGDMRISLQVAAMITGFFLLLYLSFRFLDFARFTRSSDDKKGNPSMIIAIVLLAAGSIAWFGGKVLQAVISRQREYLADATSVQFTRNPEGLIGALKKIEKESTHEMPNYGKPYAHLYLDNPSFFSSIFATHPPLEKRIEILQGDREGHRS